MQVNMKLTDGKMKFLVDDNRGHEIIADYVEPYGSDEGMSALEILLSAYATCMASALLSILRGKMKKTITDISSTVTGFQRERFPKIFESLTMDLQIQSPDATEEDIQSAIDAADEKICPVWNMIKHSGVQATVNFTLTRP